MKLNDRILKFTLAVALILALPSCTGNPTGGDTTATTDTTESSSSIQQDPDSPEAVRMLPEQTVKILSQNVLCSGTQNGSTLQERKVATAKYMLELSPDSIGLQEATSTWADYLDEQLGAKYARVGVECKEGADKGDFATYVYYLKNKYRVIATDTFWMSTTPQTPSKYNDTVDKNRTCTWVILENIETGFRYVHMNCHLDWKDPTANTVQIEMIRNMMLRFDALGYPVFTTGDFNTNEGSFSYEQMLGDARIADSRYETENTDTTVTTFGNGTSIDYCFVTKGSIDVLQFDVIENNHNGTTVSDHNGVYTYAKVHALPAQDHGEAIAKFIAGTQLGIVGSSVSDLQMDLTIPQARTESGMVARLYEITLADSLGNTVMSTVAVSNFYHPLPPRYVYASITGGLPGEAYRLSISPISIFGDRGATLVQEFIWAGERIVVVEPRAADIADIAVQGSSVVDRSPNQLEITMCGSATVANGAMVFDRKGNFRTESLNDQYDKMTDGFSMELLINTGKDVMTGCNYASNLHAGGFGYGVENGKIHFKIHNGSGYVGVTADIEAETTYHAVAVFNGSGICLYLNGRLVGSIKFSGSMKLPTEEGAKYLCIGADSNKSGDGEYAAECTVYHVAIYSQSLGAGEVFYLYQNC